MIEFSTEMEWQCLFIHIGMRAFVATLLFYAHPDMTLGDFLPHIPVYRA